MNIAQEIERLAALAAAGSITPEEFSAAKAHLIHGSASPPPLFAFNGIGPITDRSLLIVMHLSQLAGFILPFAGLAAPIVIWQLNKTKHPDIDAHGKMVANWVISAAIYLVCSVPLVLLFGLGVLLMACVGICSIIFAIMGALRANEGVLWSYPLSIPFFKQDQPPIA